MAKMRIDKLLINRGLAKDAHHAMALIMAGEVWVNQQRISTTGTQVKDNTLITLKEKMPYVSRGGYKLAAALDAFAISPAGEICADVGASTGGFTDVLLQRDAKKIYAIDVGYGDFAWKLRQNERVVLMERTNARYLQQLPDSIELTVIDASFISLKIILPAVEKWLQDTATIVALIKPQFEVEKSDIESGGVVRRKAIHQKILLNILNWISTREKLFPTGLIASPIVGPAGNKEFLVQIETNPVQNAPSIDELIETALATINY